MMPSTLFCSMAMPHATAAWRLVTLNARAVSSLTSQVQKSLPRNVFGYDLRKWLEKKSDDIANAMRLLTVGPECNACRSLEMLFQPEATQGPSIALALKVAIPLTQQPLVALTSETRLRRWWACARYWVSSLPARHCEMQRHLAGSAVRGNLAIRSSLWSSSFFSKASLDKL